MPTGGPPPSCERPGSAAALSSRAPNAHPRAKRSPRLTDAGPRPKLRSMTGVPGLGFRSNLPLRSAGRAVGNPVDWGSRPVVMLYGTPLFATRNGITLNRHSNGTDDIATDLCRTGP